MGRIAVGSLRIPSKAKGCNHIMRKFGNYAPHYYANYSVFEQHPEPTLEEINKNRMWKAPCGHWVSLIGMVKELEEAK